MDMLPNRKRNRLKDFDYSSSGAYFVTICTRDKRGLLSQISSVGSDAYIAPEVKLTKYGEAAEEYLRRIPGIDRYVIMPNHIHLIVVKDGQSCSTLSQDMRSFKTMVTKAVKEKIWQASFYDHIIRNERDYSIKAKYIENNPAKWDEDELFEGYR